MLLARKGYKVLLVDRATFPSDTISTHILWPPGAEVLGRWGLLDRLTATGLPAICRQMSFDVGPFALRGNADATNAFFSAITGAIPMSEFMSEQNLGRILAAASH